MSKAFPMPVRMIGPGSQPDDETLQYLEIPRGVDTFEMPSVPETADALALKGARDLLGGFLDQLSGWDPAAQWQGPRIDLMQMPQDALVVTNQMLGEGEVSIKVGGAQPLRVQESVFAGLWRVCAIGDDGRVHGDWLEAAPLPQAVVEAAYAQAVSDVPDAALPPGAMNSPALLAEIRAQLATRTPGASTHVINLTLFPMTPEDHAVMERALPVGPVAIMSRGFGNCRITSTGTRGVWRVQYFNNMNTLILNTIEVVDVPETALAAAEDLEDSKERLAELVAWMDESYAERAAG